VFPDIQVPQILMLQGGLGHLCVWPLFGDSPYSVGWGGVDGTHARVEVGL
jgi:23S rRNA A1618 N6-methylase RlmF